MALTVVESARVRLHMLIVVWLASSARCRQKAPGRVGLVPVHLAASRPGYHATVSQSMLSWKLWSPLTAALAAQVHLILDGLASDK